MFLEAISRFPLYLLFRCAPQKDAAAIRANIECSLQKFVISTNEKTYCNYSETTPSKIPLKFSPPLQRRGILRTIKESYC